MLNLIYLTIDYFNCNNVEVQYSLLTVKEGYIINFLVKNLKITIQIDDYIIFMIKNINISDIQLSKIINRINYIDREYSPDLPRTSNLNNKILEKSYKITDDTPITFIKNINYILDIHKKYNNFLIYKILLRKIIDKYTDQSMDYLFDYLVI